MLKNVYHSSNLCILSYIFIEDHFLFISCQANPLTIRGLVFFILKFFISKNRSEKKHLLQTWKTQHGTLDYSYMKEFIGDYYMWYFRSDEYECTNKSIELNEHTDEAANKQDIKSFNLISILMNELTRVKILISIQMKMIYMKRGRE